MGDEVWAVFDHDQHPNVQEAIIRCKANKVGVAQSNPCFELWLILHDKEFDKPQNSREMQKELKNIRPEYDRIKIPDCQDLVTRVELAEERGERMLNRREQEGDPYGNPSTTVGNLTKAIRNASNLAKRGG